MLDFQAFANTAGEWLDAAGVIVILGGFIASTLVIVIRIFSPKGVHHLYRSYRQNLARSILVGLEFLVAGDIIRSVAGELSYRSIGILAILILIRLLLGMSLEMEIDGHWPWQRSRKKTS